MIENNLFRILVFSIVVVVVVSCVNTQKKNNQTIPVIAENLTHFAANPNGILAYQ